MIHRDPVVCAHGPGSCFAVVAAAATATVLLDSTRSTATANATATAAEARGTWLVNIERGKRLGCTP